VPPAGAAVTMRTGLAGQASAPACWPARHRTTVPAAMSARPPRLNHLMHSTSVSLLLIAALAWWRRTAKNAKIYATHTKPNGRLPAFLRWRPWHRPPALGGDAAWD